MNTRTDNDTDIAQPSVASLQHTALVILTLPPPALCLVASAAVGIFAFTSNLTGLLVISTLPPPAYSDNAGYIQRLTKE